MMDKNDWAVSETGGPKISGYDAAKVLKVSYSQLYKLIERGELKRAEPRNPMFRKQPLVFFLMDIVRFGRNYGVISEERANELLHPNPAAAIVAA